MTRSELLAAAQTKDTVVANNAKLVAKEKRKFEKLLNDKEYNLLELKTNLEERLSAETELSWDVINVELNRVESVENEIIKLKEFIITYYA